MKKLINIFLLTILIFTLGCSGSDQDTVAQEKVTKTDSKSAEVVWMKFDEGIEKAVKENKNIIVDFYTDWCHWCKVMDEKTFSEPGIAKKLHEKFVTIRINAESNTEKAHFQGQEFTNTQLTQAFRVTGFPSLGFISPQKEVITVIPGYIPAEQFSYLLDYIDKECYKKKMSLDEFIKKKGECDEDKNKTTNTKS